MNQYHIYEKIGKGKHSTVYKGRKKKTITYFAIKSVDKSQKARVLQEVRTIHALDHKNVLKFYAWYETTNHLWLILEFCVGGDLKNLLTIDIRLPESSVHDFGRDLLVALQYLHHKEIIYCDLKPSNVLLDENGRLKLGGFGLSRRLSEINKAPLQPNPQAKQGAPCYMAPELFSEGVNSTASDLWALGCVLYECAMGRPPFMNSSFNQLMNEVLNEEPPPVQGVSQEFSDLLSRLLDKNPATRIKWPELIRHPFWQGGLQELPIPPEPALEAFIRKYNLAPQPEFPELLKSKDRVKRMRQSVDVTRLSRVALSNLEKDAEISDYAAAEAQHGDIHIADADAELDFEEVKEEGGDDEDASSTSTTDDAAAIDQGSAASPGEADIMNAMAGGRSMAVAHLNMPDRQGMEQYGNLRASQKLGSLRASGTGRLSSGAGYSGGGAAYSGGGAGPEEDMEVNLPQTDAPSVEALIWHPSDSVVKPIVANRRIERIPEPHYDLKALNFQALTLQEMLNANQKDLEVFLTHIYRAIANAAPLRDKINVLSFFETLCANTSAANVLVNSSLTLLFIRMLRNARAPTLRVRLASVLGLLVRHATYISEELAETGIIDTLSEALKDRNEKVRRRVMATLGELLFYIATQQQDVASGATAQQAADAWRISSSTLALVTRLLKPGEDEIAQHYAVKTVENICSQGGDWAARFATQEVATSLVNIFTTIKNENMRATTASTLYRLMRYSPNMLVVVVDKYGLKLFITGLNDSSSKVQIACLNMLNQALSLPEFSTKAKASLTEEQSLIPSIKALLDHTALVVRGKAVVCILFLSRLSPRWLLEDSKSKLFTSIEKLQREKDEYVVEVMSALKAEIGSIVPAICKQVTEELNRIVTRKPLPSGSSSLRSSIGKTPLLQFQIVLQLLTSPVFRSSIVTPALITNFIKYLVACSAPGAMSLPGIPEFRTMLTEALQAICGHSDLLLTHHEAILTQLLPILSEGVAATSDSWDTRFASLQMLCDICGALLMDSDLGGSGAAGGMRPSGISAAAINTATRRHVLPLMPQLLSDEDPMPLYALKLLVGLLEANSEYVSDVEQLGLAARFFDFLSLDHPNNNVHNIKVCCLMIASGRISIRTLETLKVPEKVSEVLKCAHSKGVDAFYEPVLNLVLTLCRFDMSEKDARRSSGNIIAAFVPEKDVFLDLATHPESGVSSLAATCTHMLVDVFRDDCVSWLLSEGPMLTATKVLNEDYPLQSQLHLLEAMQLALGARVQPSAPERELSQLCDAMMQLSFGDPTLKNAANVALSLLQPYVGARR